MVEVLQAENAELKAENYRLSLRVKALESELYGSRADRRQPEPDQRQETFAEMDQAVQEAPPPAPKQATTARKRKTSKKGPKPG